jgi:osmotically-inducible protein OsmY
MKTRTTLVMTTGLLLALASVCAWSQPAGRDAGADGAAMAAPAEPPAKSEWQANRALRHKVYAAIEKHKEISAGNISVVVKGGTVVLDGTLADGSQIDKVSGIAEGVPGVLSVTNRLTVKKPFGGQ